MNNPSILKYTSAMLSYKEDLNDLANSIKDIENQANDNLQSMLIKSSSYVKINKNIKEIGLMSQALVDNDSQGSEKLLLSLRRKIFETQYLFIEDLQKSMLKAAEALIDAENTILLLANFDKMLKVFNNMAKKLER